jgi:hypothetical protein
LLKRKEMPRGSSFEGKTSIIENKWGTTISSGQGITTVWSFKTNERSDAFTWGGSDIAGLQKCTGV